MAIQAARLQTEKDEDEEELKLRCLAFWVEKKRLVEIMRCWICERSQIKILLYYFSQIELDFSGLVIQIYNPIYHEQILDFLI